MGSTFTVLKKTKYFLYSSILAAIVAVIANLILIPNMGLIGACIAISLSQVSMFLYRWYKSYKYVNFENGRKLLCITFVAIGSLLVYYLMEDNILRLTILIFSFLCFLICNVDIIRIARGRILPLIPKKH